MKKSNFLVLAIGLIIGFMIGFAIQSFNNKIIIKKVHIDNVEKARVEKVIDGDTVILENGKHIRYLGINTPETNEQFGDRATMKNKSLVEGKTLKLVRGNRNKDKYNRYLRYVYADETFVNAELISQGLAEAYIFDSSDPMSQVFIRLEQYAKLKRKGMWVNN